MEKTIPVKPVILIALCFCISIAATVLAFKYGALVLGSIISIVVIVVMLVMSLITAALIILAVTESRVRGIAHTVSNFIPEKWNNSLPGKIIKFLLTKKLKAIGVLITGISVVILVITIAYSVYAGRLILSTKAADNIAMLAKQAN